MRYLRSIIKTVTEGVELRFSARRQADPGGGVL